MAVTEAMSGDSRQGGLEIVVAADVEEHPRLRPSNPLQWTVEEVGDWLVEKGFAQYRDAFLLNHVNGTILVKMDRASLAELIPSLGHRLSVLDEIERISGPKVPRHVGEGVVGGVTGFASKFMHGLSHLVNDPIEGVSKDGVNGLMKGLGTGFAGAIQYPVEGVAVFSRQLGDGFRHTPDAIFGTGSGAQESQSGSRASSGFEVAKPQGLVREAEEGQQKPGHVGEGLLFGFRKLGSGVYDGVTGLVIEPMRAAASSSRDTVANQSAAIARGVAKGLTGAICKPMAGTFDLASSTVEGLMATPQALMTATKDGPSIQDTPTFKRLAALRLPSSEIIRQRLGMEPKHSSEVVAQIDELRQNSRRDRHENLD